MNQLSANSDSPGNASRGRRIRPLDWARPAGAVDLVEREMRVQVRRRRLQWVAGAGAAVLALLVADLAWQEHSPARSGASASAAKFVTSPRRQVLPDGSVVDLKSGTDFALDYSEATRRVWLRRGEAHFQIAKNPHRPFLVMARGVEVRAVGTAFSVELARTKVDVMVTEGRIAVKHHPLSGTDSPANSAGGTSEKVAAPAASAISVDAGHLISIDTEPGRAVDPTVQSVDAQEIADRMAWRDVWLELNFTPLSDVIAVVNQQGGSRLTLAESNLGRLKLSGSLRANNVVVLLQILETSYGVTAERRASGEIVLRRGR